MPINPVQTRRREPHAKCARLRLGAVHTVASTRRPAGSQDRPEAANVAAASSTAISNPAANGSAAIRRHQNHVAVSLSWSAAAGRGPPSRASRTLGKQQRLIADLRGIVPGHRARPGNRAHG
jgi:hypothetical protein